MADNRLDTEAVQHRAEDLVVVEPSQQALVERRFLGLDPVDDALVQVCRPQAPDATGEVDVVGVVRLREVIDRARLLRERQRVAPAPVLDLDEALLDVDVRGPVLPHRPQLDQVAAWDPVANREQHVERAEDVVALGRDSVAPRTHRQRRRRLLPVVDDRLGAKLFEQAVDQLAVLGRADLETQSRAGELLPGFNPVGERCDRSQRAAAELLVPATAREVVED
jgi:hypothetical protein